MHADSRGRPGSVGVGSVGAGGVPLGGSSKQVSLSGLAGLQLITIHCRSIGTVERSDSYFPMLTSPLTSMGALWTISRLECFSQSR